MTAAAVIAVVFLAGVTVGFIGAWRWLKPRAYRLSRVEVLWEYGTRPAVSDGFNAAAPMQRTRSPNDQLVWRHMPDPSRVS